MPDWIIWVVIGSAIVIFAIIEGCYGCPKPLKRGFLAVAIGLAAFCAVNLCAGFTGVSLPVSTLSLSVSAAGGIPGVTLMLIMNMFL